MLFSVLRDFFGATDDFMFLHTGGELTDLSLVRHGVLQSSITFPIGTHTLIRKIARAMKTVPGEARTLLGARAPGENGAPVNSSMRDSPTSKKFDAAITEAASDWITAFDDARGNLAEQGMLPRTVFMISEDIIGAWFGFFLNQLVSGDTSKQESALLHNKPVQHPIAARVLLQKTFSHYLESTFDGPPDYFLNAESIFFGKAHQ
jgi:hypothetical protein